MKKENWIQSDFKFEELHVGMEIMNGESKKVSRVTGLTSSSVEVFNQKAKAGGIDSKNWYDMNAFNRLFTRLEQA